MVGIAVQVKQARLNWGVAGKCNMRTIAANIKDGCPEDSVFYLESVSNTNSYRIKRLSKTNQVLYLTAASAANGTPLTWAVANTGSQNWEFMTVPYVVPNAHAMLDKLDDDTAFSSYLRDPKHTKKQDSREKRDTMRAIGRAMANLGYHPTFIIGMLGHIHYEGNIGYFEGISNESYMIVTRNTYPDYDDYFSKKYVYEKYPPKNDMELSKLKGMVENLLTKTPIKGAFGLGCIQWTGDDRTLNLVDDYIAKAKPLNNINEQQATEVEAALIHKELTEKVYQEVYFHWLAMCKENLNSPDAAYQAGRDIVVGIGGNPNYLYISNSFQTEAIARGTNAQNLYIYLTS